MSNILVNATAARTSGALSILNQFIESISNYNQSDIYYIFVDPSYKQLSQSDIKYICVDTSKWISRILWDERGMKQWIEKNCIKANLIISLQNTGINYNTDVLQLIYYHQPLPLSDYRWSALKRNELLFLMYKTFYSFFVSRYIHSNTQIVVQIPSIKEAFLRKFKIKASNIHIIPPTVKNVDYNSIDNESFEDGCIHFVYPATPFVYKNHIVLVEALNCLKQQKNDLLYRIRIHFTFKEKDDLSIYKAILKYSLLPNFVFEGTLSHNRLLGMYKSMKALLFPSYIETFGLPQLEAAAAGIPIIVSDLPYARDVVGAYEGVRFVKYDDAKGWATSIVQLCESEDILYTAYIQNQGCDTWKLFFNLIDSLK